MIWMEKITDLSSRFYGNFPHIHEDMCKKLYHLSYTILLILLQFHR